MEVSKNITVIPARKHRRTEPGEEKPKLRVAAYCRVSTDTEEQATSYETQIDHYTAYINGHPDWTLAGVFADDDDIIGLNQKTLKKEVLPIKPYFLYPIYPLPNIFHPRKESADGKNYCNNERKRRRWKISHGYHACLPFIQERIPYRPD